MNTSKAAVVVNAIIGKISSIVGYTFAAFGAIGLIVELSEGLENSGFIVGAIFITSGVLLILKGIRTKQIIKRFKLYISLISVHQMSSLDAIAAATSQSVDFVKDDLQKMINKSFFASASINAATNEIIIDGVVLSPFAAAPAQQAQAVAQYEMEVYTCRGCGASGTKTKGVPGNCDYCGSHVK